MTVKKIFRRFRLNSDALQKRGVGTKITKMSMIDGNLVLEFEDEPSRGELERILALLRQDCWEIVEE